MHVVKRITKHDQEIKVVYGVRVAACHFDVVARSILEDESTQPHASMPKRFVVSRVPLGTDAKDLRTIIDPSLVLKDEWQWREIRPLGDHAWLIGAATAPPIIAGLKIMERTRILSKY